jgi:hypothetical protein
MKKKIIVNNGHKFSGMMRHIVIDLFTGGPSSLETQYENTLALPAISSCLNYKISTLAKHMCQLPRSSIIIFFITHKNFLEKNVSYIRIRSFNNKKAF